jgi:4-alpha-glucanotransferase
MQDRLREGDYDEAVKEYYLYAQWIAREQIHSTAEDFRSRGGLLYLDFPLGVHRDGFDTWSQRRLFALGASGGAPPDPFFTKGQNWGFPPLHPERLREAGYGYFISSLRHHLQCAGMLRIDHVMGLHRLFWIPQGSGAADGAYVHYPAEELYAVLCLESERHRALIVGENLGTVPSYVNRDLAKHRIRGMFVGQFSLDTDPQRPPQEAPAAAVASLNTHDTPTFASFWSGADIQDRLELGLLDEAGAARERQIRCGQRESLVAFLQSRGLLGESSPEADAVLAAWLSYLASGPSELLLINLEDLWLEARPQNTPGTWDERPNWRRKASLAFEEFSQEESIINRLREVHDYRNKSD